MVDCHKMATERNGRSFVEKWVAENTIKSATLAKYPESYEEAGSHEVGLADVLFDTCIIVLRDIH